MHNLINYYLLILFFIFYYELLKIKIVELLLKINE